MNRSRLFVFLLFLSLACDVFAQKKTTVPTTTAVATTTKAATTTVASTVAPGYCTQTGALIGHLCAGCPNNGSGSTVGSYTLELVPAVGGSYLVVSSVRWTGPTNQGLTNGIYINYSTNLSATLSRPAGGTTTIWEFTTNTSWGWGPWCDAATQAFIWNNYQRNCTLNPPGVWPPAINPPTTPTKQGPYLWIPNITPCTSLVIALHIGCYGQTCFGGAYVNASGTYLDPSTYWFQGGAWYFQFTMTDCPSCNTFPPTCPYQGATCCVKNCDQTGCLWNVQDCPAKGVKPTIKCVACQGDICFAEFGYDATGFTGDALDIAITGSNNYFSSGLTQLGDLGQPTLFYPGSVSVAFTAYWNKTLYPAGIRWNLNGYLVNATEAMAATGGCSFCESPAQITASVIQGNGMDQYTYDVNLAGPVPSSCSTGLQSFIIDLPPCQNLGAQILPANCWTGAKNFVDSSSVQCAASPNFKGSTLALPLTGQCTQFQVVVSVDSQCSRGVGSTLVGGRWPSNCPSCSQCKFLRILGPNPGCPDYTCQPDEKKSAFGCTCDPCPNNCRSDQVFNPTTCSCDPCVPLSSCPKGKVLSANQCQCDPCPTVQCIGKQVLDQTGQCPKCVSCPSFTCPPGQKPSDSFCNCTQCTGTTCNPGYTVDPSDACNCIPCTVSCDIDQGLVVASDLCSCRPCTKRTSCDPGFELEPIYQCTCDKCQCTDPCLPDDQGRVTYRKDSNCCDCVPCPIQTQEDCPPGYELVTGGNCPTCEPCDPVTCNAADGFEPDPADPVCKCRECKDDPLVCATGWEPVDPANSCLGCTPCTGARAPVCLAIDGNKIDPADPCDCVSCKDDPLVCPTNWEPIDPQNHCLGCQPCDCPPGQREKTTNLVPNQCNCEPCVCPGNFLPTDPQNPCNGCTCPDPQCTPPNERYSPDGCSCLPCPPDNFSCAPNWQLDENNKCNCVECTTPNPPCTIQEEPDPTDKCKCRSCKDDNPNCPDGWVPVDPNNGCLGCTPCVPEVCVAANGFERDPTDECKCRSCKNDDPNCPPNWEPVDPTNGCLGCETCQGKECTDPLKPYKNPLDACECLPCPTFDCTEDGWEVVEGDPCPTCEPCDPAATALTCRDDQQVSPTNPCKCVDCPVLSCPSGTRPRAGAPRRCGAPVCDDCTPPTCSAGQLPPSDPCQPKCDDCTRQVCGVGQERVNPNDPCSGCRDCPDPNCNLTAGDRYSDDRCSCVPCQKITQADCPGNQILDENQCGCSGCPQANCQVGEIKSDDGCSCSPIIIIPPPNITVARCPPSERDACGICRGGNRTCIGCDGKLHSPRFVDACGVLCGDGSTCGGCRGDTCNVCTQPLDKCGVCGGNSTTCYGCDHVPASGKIYDICGVCGGNGTACLGCGGVPFAGPCGTNVAAAAGATAAVFAALAAVGIIAAAILWRMQKRPEIMYQAWDDVLKEYVTEVYQSPVFEEAATFHNPLNN